MLPQYTQAEIDQHRQHMARRSRMQMAARFARSPAKKLETPPPVAAVEEVAPPTPPPPVMLPFKRDILFIGTAPDDMPDASAPQPLFSVRGIIKMLAYARSIPVEAICSPRRTADLVKVRQDAMFIAWALTVQSLPEIGRRFGGRDHTTVLHAVRKRAKELGIAGLPDMRERAKECAKAMLFDASAMCAEISR